MTKALINLAFSLIALAPFFDSLAATPAWCAKSGKSFEMHVFGGSFTTKNQKVGMANELQSFLNEVHPGDRLIIYRHETSGFTKDFDKCSASCEKVGLDGMFATDCSPMLAKKDQREYKFALAKVIKNAVETKDERFDVYQSMKRLYEAHKDENGQGNMVIGVISMVPNGVDPSDKGSLDREFTRVIQNKIYLPSGFPSVKYIGRVKTDLLDSYWKSVFDISGIKHESK
jgi:hypothetical protein